MQVDIIQEGKTLRCHTHNGQQYIEVPKEGPYQIKLTNTGFYRVLAVVSVDGINVVNGEDASLEGSGYVLGAFQSTEIKGWRRTDSEVAEFTFGKDTISYAEGTGRGVRNTGVIGVAVFEEQVFAINTYIPPIIIIEKNPWRPWRPWHPWESPFYYGTTIGASSVLRGEEKATWTANSGGSEDTSGSFKCSCASEESQTLGGAVMDSVDLGTGYGGRAVQHTSEVPFQRASSVPQCVFTFRYGTREKLKSWGVPIEAPYVRQRNPNPFPKSKPVACKPPTGWNG